MQETLFGVYHTFDTEYPINIVVAGDSYKASVPMVQDLIRRLEMVVQLAERDQRY